MNNLEIITKNLNPEQKKAVENIEGPLLILAGAGSGKTRVLTHRMANMLALGHASTQQILCVTFTNKAAKEMEHRIYQMLSQLNVPVYEPLWISTFHSFCVRILRLHFELLGYQKNFGINDSGDSLSQLKKILNAKNVSDTLYPAKKIQSRISNAKMLGLTAGQVEKAYSNLMDKVELEVYRDYEKELKKSNTMDFDDLLLNTYLLYKKQPDLLKHYQEKFKYIMVDEYQDTNHIQYLLVKMLSEGHRNLCVVGDEDQSIYSWRGADISNILNFEKDFHEAQIVKLEKNYRSTAAIVKAASHLIENNSQRKSKHLFTDNEMGEMISVREEKNEYDEARFVVKTISDRLQQGHGNYNDYAVFYRTNAQSRVLEDQLRSQSVPYRLIGGMRFYERQEIKNILCYMKLAINISDDVALKRIINIPVRGIGKTTVEKLEALAMQNQLTLLQSIEKSILDREFNAGTTSKLRGFYELVVKLAEASGQKQLVDFYDFVLEQTRYVETLKIENTLESQSRIENLKEFYNALTQFTQEHQSETTLVQFLEQMALVSDADNLNQEQNAVTMMTLHISKGLEFPNVFIVGLEENLFPNVGDEDDDSDDLEEERRLAYVGITRAREKLWLTHTKSRKVWGQDQFNPPSRFIKELPQDILEKSSGVFAGGFAQNLWQKQSGYGRGFVRDSSSQNGFEHQSFPDEDTQAFNDGAGFSLSSAKSTGLSKGHKVRHPTFGVGSVYATEGSGDQQKVSVVFADHTVKKFVLKYAKLERV